MDTDCYQVTAYRWSTDAAGEYKLLNGSAVRSLYIDLKGLHRQYVRESQEVDLLSDWQTEFNVSDVDLEPGKASLPTNVGLSGNDSGNATQTYEMKWGAGYYDGMPVLLELNVDITSTTGFDSAAWKVDIDVGRCLRNAVVVASRYYSIAGNYGYRYIVYMTGAIIIATATAAPAWKLKFWFRHTSRPSDEYDGLNVIARWKANNFSGRLSVRAGVYPERDLGGVLSLTNPQSQES